MEKSKGNVRSWPEFISRTKAITLGMYSTVLFVLSILFILFGAAFSNGGAWIFGFVVGLTALLRGMFLK